MIRRLSAFVVAMVMVVSARSASAAIAIDVTTFKDLTSASTTMTTPAFSTAASNELLLAFISTDYLSGTNIRVQSVTGAGLTWTLVVRTNAQSGTSEIWRAFAPSPLTNATVTATTTQSVVSSITVMSFTGADPTGTGGSGAIGAVASGSAATGAPTATLVTTRNNSWVFGVGNDYDTPTSRTPAAGQSIVHQYLPSIGDTYWVQKQNAPTPAAGTSVRINDTAPTGDRYNLSICEILAAPAASTFTLSGSIAPAASSSGATVTLAGVLLTAVVNSSGNYTVTGVPNGTYTVTAAKSGFTFSPPNQSATVNGADVSGVNFTVQPNPTYTISGTISPASAGNGASVTLSGAAGATVVADASGNYTFNGLANGSYTVTPQKAGYVFTPGSRAAAVSGAAVPGVDFAGLAVSGTISGTISPAADGNGATVTLAGALLTAVANAAGNYTITGVPNGTYTVSAAKSGFTFSPVNRSATVNGADVTGVNFTAQANPTYTIAGTISPVSAGSGANVTLSGLPGAATVADSSGNYTFNGVPDGSYTVTPQKTGYAFTPASRPATVSGSPVSGIDFTAQALTANISGTITPAADASGATVIIGETVQATVNSSGNYTLNNVPNGTHTVVVFKAGYAFTPASRSVTVNGVAVTGVNFTASSTSNASVVGQWSAPFDVGLVAVNMVMMHTGKVLMFSGAFSASGIERVWDPATGSVTLVPNPYYNLFCAGHSQLADGRILLVGGYDSASLGAADANIFDPVTQSWTRLPDMAYRRWYPTSTTLPDGRALVMSGAQTCLSCLAEVPEIFDPATNTFSTMPGARLGVPYYPFMFVMPDGSVLDAGANEASAPTRTLDVNASRWTTVDPIVTDGHSAAMYLPGKILKSGTAADSGTAGAAAPTAFVLDMTKPAPSWRQVASMANARAFHNSTILPDGTVLITGGGTMLNGYDVTKSVFAAELWSPVTETWQTLSSAVVPRLYHSTALLLPDARVLTAGSGNDYGAVDQTRAEIFSPPYLFKGARPSIAGAPDLIQYGASFAVQTPDAASIASVSLIRPGAVTHAFDEDQRFLSLAFTAGSGSLTIQAPANANLAPPGYYMLFLLNTAGVPSVASFVHFAAPGTDHELPTAPISLSGQGAISAASLTWTASTDNTGVALYNVHSAATSGFQPSAANRVGQTTSTTFTHTGAAAGLRYYVVTAQDVAGNISLPSNETSVLVLSDTSAPFVTITSPANQAAVNGSITVAATASDDVGVAGVQFQLDGQPLGAERTSAPFSIAWNSATTSNGSHTLAAVARDAAGNRTTASVDVTVSNTTQTPGGLVAAFGFNEGSGVQTTDASGQGNTGTVSSATWTAAGKYGSALSFNGTSAWVSVADAASLDLTTGMTLEAWVKPSAATGWRTVILKEDTQSMTFALYSANNASRPAGFIHTTTDVALNGTAAVAQNVWTHLALTFDGTTMRMFVNGTQVSTKALSGAATVSAGAIRIGGNAVWGEYFKGLIDEVRIYNRALTATEIQTDMNIAIP